MSSNNLSNHLERRLYAADSPMFLESFPIFGYTRLLQYPPNQRPRGVLWVLAKIQSLDPSPQIARQKRILFTLINLIICKCELVSVNEHF